MQLGELLDAQSQKNTLYSIPLSKCSDVYFSELSVLIQRDLNSTATLSVCRYANSRCHKSLFIFKKKVLLLLDFVSSSEEESSK